MYHVVTGDAVITTLLGSCVAACLYDRITGVVGMNHFMLSNERYSRDMPISQSEAGRYGIQAMELLINAMMKRGAKRHGLCAKVFGGASIVSDASVGNFKCVGAVNCRFIRAFLENENIELVAADLGGREGRVIYFDSRDYGVFVRKIKRNISMAIAERDRKVWERSVLEHKQSTIDGRVDLWIE